MSNEPVPAMDRADFGDLLRLAGQAAAGDDALWARFLRRVPEPVRRRMAEEFFWQAHGGQAEPEACADGGDWRVWLLMAGRGFGKTRVGAEWVSAQARAHPGARIALVGGARDEVAKVMIEGPSGLIAVARTGEAVEWGPTQGVVRFSSGAAAFVYSAEAGQKLRGPEHHFAWCDELAKWGQADATWDNLMMGMRLGEWPRTIVTTTPRAVAIVRRVKALTGTVVTEGRMDENAHLSDAFRSWAAETYGGTRLGRQELDGVLFEDVEAALWTRDVLERARTPLDFAPDKQFWARVVIGVDPPASADGDACGIVVCGLGMDGVAYVLADCSVAGKRPEGWARAVCDAAAGWDASLVVAEKNQGGDMVGSVLRAVDAGAAPGSRGPLPVRLVSATTSKAARAEPVATRFETGRAKLAGRFPQLEDELAGMTAGRGYRGPGRSPDRADAMVWAMSALIRPRAEPRMRML